MNELLIRQNDRAADAETATAALQSVFGSVAATLAGEGELRFEQQALVDDGISVTRVSSAGAPLRVAVDDAPDLIVLAVREGTLTLTRGPEVSEIGPGEIGVIPFGRSAELRWQQVVTDAFSFPLTSVGRLLGPGIDRTTLHVTRSVSSSATMTELWHRTAKTLAGDVLQNTELYESDMIRDQAIAALLGVAIETFGITDVSEDDRAVDARVLERAETYMRAHLGSPIAVPDIAAAAKVSLRGLQMAYKRNGHETPILHLRRLRMTAAREQLVDASDRSLRVGAVARALGYTNLGRFSTHYREAFGEPPAETLRRGRTPAID